MALSAVKISWLVSGDDSQINTVSDLRDCSDIL